MNEDLIERFAGGYPFALDDYQLEALESLTRGESVLVAAPTGSGKTVVGEFAVWLALEEGGKAFYTTPLKALSNQKFGDFVALYGSERVGLLTGDNSINSHAPVVVMTTEVLRNMIYERSDLLRDLRYVVLDEVHYLQDPYRGAVWEEVIIHLPLDVKVVSLSATVSNAEEFADWIQTCRGATSAILEERRPVALRQHYLVDGQLLPMFVGSEGAREPNPQVSRLESARSRGRGRGRGSPPGRIYRRRFPHRGDVIEVLEAEEMLPAIYFIFSRKGCDAAVTQCLREGLRLTSDLERTRIREFAELRTSYLDEADLDALGYDLWVEGLVAGFAAHHAGLVPVFKETVEELFKAGLVKAVFATETLSLGINMPARSVVIESLFKFTGDRHELMTPGEFTQLTGRAGRRGIDVLGHAVVLEQRDLPFRQVAALASTTIYPLLSSFQPSYNMATNLVRNYSREEAEHLLNSSFAQYRADKEVVVWERQIERNEAYLASYREKMECELGDFGDYWKLREQSDLLERSAGRWEQSARRDQIRNALSSARPGQVFLPGGKLPGPVLVLGRERSKRGEPRLIALTTSRRLVRLSPSDFERQPRPVGRVHVPKEVGHPRALDQQTRRKLAAALGAVELEGEGDEVDVPTAEGSTVANLKTRIHRHPCHRCPDRDKHAQWGERASRLTKETEGLRKRVRSRSETISRAFERVLSILEEFGYVKQFALSDKGKVLAHIYNENDLLVAETLLSGGFSDLDPAEIASLVSCFVFESRGPFEITGDLPSQDSKRAYKRVLRSLERILKVEKSTGLELTRGVESGFADLAYVWCRGAELEEVLTDELSAGDFIRSCKQTLDLLKQLQEATPFPELEDKFAEAMEGIDRGVVSYTGVL